jgi:UDP-N-acetylglucosamine:LPS N-acetylglucosamine transferase
LKKIRVLFPYVEAGYGHIMPMRSIDDTFRRKYGDKVEVISSKFFTETNDKYMIKYEKKFSDHVRLYNRIPPIGYLGSFANHLFGVKLSTFGCMRLLSPIACKRSIKHMKELGPDVVFSTHWASNYYAEKQKENKPYTIMYCPDARLNKLFEYRCDLSMISMPYGYYKALREKRYNINNIKLVPFLIRNEAFEISKDKKEMRRTLGLPENNFTVLFAEGGYGIGKMAKITKLLLKRHVPLTVITVCGTNTKLYEKLKALKSTDEITYLPLGFADNMLQLQAASDVFCGKSGNILAESTFFGNLSIVTHFANMIERNIADHYINTVGCAIKEFSPKKTADLICGFAQDESKLEPYRKAAEAYHNNFGAEEAADLIWEFIKEKYPGIE